MDATGWGDECDEYSEIGDKGEIGFIDFEDDKSVCSYNPDEESDVIVSVPFPFIEQKPQSISVDEVAADSITIRNATDDSVQLWGVHIYASNPKDLFTLSLMEPSAKGFVGSSDLDDRVLQPHKTLTIWLSCTPKDVGLQTCIVHVDVGDEKLERVVFLLAEDNISKSLASNKPYHRERRKTSNFTVDSYVTGVRPSRPPNRGFRHRLPPYEIPREIREEIESTEVPDSIHGGLTRKNYVSFFRTLLIMEELRLEEDIRAYDMENVTMKSRGRQFLTLEVLGLAERRPSLVHGDSVFARIATERADEATVYEGCIHRVEADQVYLKFADNFHQRHRDGHSYNVRFMYNRVNMRRLYHAIESADKLHQDILFPSMSMTNRQIKPNFVVPISPNLNEEQLNAVEMILGCKGGVPYMINGPPGTGKTMTLVEAILQIYKTRKGSRILVCASSNCAADHVLEKILKVIDVRENEVIDVRENEVFRLNASSRSFDDLKEEYRRFCFYEDFVFRCPPLNALLRYRIIITTYMSSSMLYAEGVKRGHFSHIILDEAGQASEPESMVPISNLCRDDTVIVLAGDPAQLGPVIFSPLAKNHGLGKSYLERLFECELYVEGDEDYVTTLLRNYRCHPEILELPSKLFYRGELIACHEAVKSSPWEDLLLNKEFPVLFKGVQAYDEREGNNPSWFNRTEASMVVKLIKKLTARDISEEDIGVITPYRQQVAKIKKALENDEIFDVKIGSVEQFQGQEREVIIISTVRSTVKHEDFDRVHYLGFLSNPKRFNVAITRAKSLLVIIGNPHIICKDPYWAKLLWRCVENNSYEGCSLPEKECFDDVGDTPTEGWPHSEEKAHDGKANSWGDIDRQANSWGDANGQANSWEDTEIKDGQANSWEDDDGKLNSWRDAEKDDGQANSWGNVEEKHDPEVSCRGNGQANSWDNVEEKHDPVVSCQDEYVAQPCKEEDEWSDGWK